MSPEPPANFNIERDIPSCWFFDGLALASSSVFHGVREQIVH